MGVSDRVNVSIVSGTLNLSTAGFGTMLVLGEHGVFPERTRLYAGSPSDILDSMLADGFTEAMAEYRAISKLMGLDLQPSSVMVGRRAVGTAQVATVTVNTATAGATYQVGFKFSTTGVEKVVSIVAPAGTPTASDIRDLLLLAINASALPVTVTEGGAGEYVVTSDFPGFGFTLTTDANQSQVATTANIPSAETVAVALSACESENPEFYGVALLNPLEADVLSLLSWCQPRRKLPMGLSTDADVITSATDDVCSEAKTLAYDGGIFWTDSFWEFPNVGLLGNRLSINVDEGSTVFNNLHLKGYTPSDIDGGERAFLELKNAFFADLAAGITVTGEDCKASSGEWMDVLLGIDWMTTRLEEEAFRAKVEAVKAGGKIPFTNAGRGIFTSILRARFQAGLRTGFLTDDPGPVIKAVDVRTLTSAERATRSLPTIEFTFYLAGAINKTSYNGKLVA